MAVLSKDLCNNLVNTEFYTAQKLKFSIKDFSGKCDQIRSFLRIWSHLLKRSLMENFTFCTVIEIILSTYKFQFRMKLFATSGCHWLTTQIRRDIQVHSIFTSTSLYYVVLLYVIQVFSITIYFPHPNKRVLSYPYRNY